MIKLVDGEEFSIIAKNKICFVTLSSETTRNAISLRMASIMQSICVTSEPNGSLFEKFLIDQNCLLIVVQSDIEGIFSSGGNLLELQKNPLAACQHYGSSIRAFCNILHSTNIPSITVLSGPSYGGGAEFALATDFRWSIGKSCDLYFTQTKFGIPAGWGGMLRLTELCPQLSPKKVSSIIIGKMKFDLTQMLNLGLIDREFHTKKSCYAAIEEWVTQAADCPKYIRDDLMKRQSFDNLNQLEEYDIEVFNKYFLKDEHKKKISEFMNGKKKK
jgi:enoyl-CoA hydratase/carnithine racemase